MNPLCTSKNEKKNKSSLYEKKMTDWKRKKDIRGALSRSDLPGPTAEPFWSDVAGSHWFSVRVLPISPLVVAGPHRKKRCCILLYRPTWRALGHGFADVARRRQPKLVEHAGEATVA